MSVPDFLLALHDVSPRHAGACRQILSFLKARGLPPATLLVVPNFHGKWPLEDHPEFLTELSGWATEGHELALHGLVHIEERPIGGGFSAAFQRRFLTGGEGEFLALSASEIRSRLETGLAAWERTGLPRPRGFVPPAWLYNEHLDPELARLGFAWTESHTDLRVPGGATLASPVISWASRDPLRRLGSQVVCPSLARLWKGRARLRIAIHPHDFDWPVLVRSIASVLTYLEGRGRFGTYSEVTQASDLP